MKRKRIKTAAVLLLSVIVMAGSAPAVLAQSAQPADAGSASIDSQDLRVVLQAADVQAFAESFFSEDKLKAWNVPGATFSVVQDQQIVYAQGFGQADIAADVPVQAEDTAFRVGSVAKVVTATALMQLVEQGKVELDADVNRYLPEPWISYSEDDPVTIAHLLTHTTGFDGGMDVRPGDLYEDLDAYYDLESSVKVSVPATIRKPGEAFKYDNFASMLQGYIVERVSGMKFEDYVQQHIFEPLGMRHSGFRTTPDAAKGMAVGYLPGLQPMPAYGIKPSDLPQGGWYATAEDAAVFMLAHLNGGSYRGARILQPETARLMQTFQVFVQPDVPVMAYGFEASMYPQYDRGHRVLAKGGDIFGFSSYMWLLPEHKIGVFVSVNANNGAVREELYRDFMHAFLPDVGVEKQPLRTSAQELEKFAGTYKDLRLESWKSQIEVAGDGKLKMEDALLGNVGLTQVGPMTFADPAGGELVFKADEQGVPTYFKYKNVGYSVRTEERKYPDVADDSPYAKAIYTLQDFNLFKEDQAAFRPEEAITRAEFTAYFMRLLKLPPSANPSAFSDAAGHGMEPEIQAAAEMGLIAGLPDGRFAPDQALTRQEAAFILYRLMQLQGAGVAPAARFEEKPADWAADAVNMMIVAGLYGPEVTTGADGSWQYRPRDAMLRQEAAALLAKLVELPSAN